MHLHLFPNITNDLLDIGVKKKKNFSDTKCSRKKKNLRIQKKFTKKMTILLNLSQLQDSLKKKRL